METVTLKSVSSKTAKLQVLLVYARAERQLQRQLQV
jgi:hypothetical protein